MNRNAQVHDNNQAALLSLKSEGAAPADSQAALSEVEEAIRICGRILNGDVGRPPMIFGVELRVEEKVLRGDKTACIVFQDAEHGNALFDGGLNPGFFVPVWMLQRRLETLKFRSAFEELFVTFLATRPEMKEAKRRRYEATQTALEQKQAEGEKKATSVLESLKQNAGNLRLPPKPFDASILMATFGYFKHDSGVVLHVRKGMHDNFQVSVAECPEGHELEGVKKAGAHAHRHHITEFAAERDQNLVGKFLLAQVLRVWMRRELRAIGALPPLEEAKVVAVEPVKPQTVTNEGEQPSADTAVISTAETPVSSKPAQVSGNNADLSEVLGNVPGGTLPSDGPARKHAAKKRTSSKDGARPARVRGARQQAAA